MKSKNKMEEEKVLDLEKYYEPLVQQFISQVAQGIIQKD